MSRAEPNRVENINNNTLLCWPLDVGSAWTGEMRSLLRCRRRPTAVLIAKGRSGVSLPFYTLLSAPRHHVHFSPDSFSCLRLLRLLVLILSPRFSVLPSDLAPNRYVPSSTVVQLCTYVRAKSRLFTCTFLHYNLP